jgi:hypothetical protein
MDYQSIPDENVSGDLLGDVTNNMLVGNTNTHQIWIFFCSQLIIHHVLSENPTLLFYVRVFRKSPYTSTYVYIYISGWWFQTGFIFHNIWDNPSH